MAVNLFTNGAGGNTWNTAGNWSQGTIPANGDGHVTTFDGTSPNCTLGGNRVCAAIDFTGYTNTLTMSTNSLSVQNNITLDTGIIISGTGALISNGTGTITSNGFTWPNNFQFSSTGTRTLSGNFTVNGTFITATTSYVFNKTTTEVFTVLNGITNNSSAGGVTGTITIDLKGGTWSGANRLGVNLNLDATSSNITLSGTVGYGDIGGTTLTYISGTVNAGTSVLALLDTCTLDTDGITFYDITVTASTGKIITINSILEVSNTLTLLAVTQNTTFAGTHGFTCSIFTCPNNTGPSTFTFKNGATYTITSLFSIYTPSISSISVFTSDHASLRANFIMPNNGNNSCNILAGFTRIDASGGRSINTFAGTVTDCININQFYDYKGTAI